MNTFIKIAGMAGLAITASMLHKIEFSEQAITFKRLASGEHLSETKVLGNTAKANIFEEVMREAEEVSSSSMETESESEYAEWDPLESHSETSESLGEQSSGNWEEYESESREENFNELSEWHEQDSTDSEEVFESASELIEMEITSPEEQYSENTESLGEVLSETTEAFEQEAREENFNELFESQEEQRD